MRNAWLDEAQAGIKISRRNINNLRYADDTTLLAKSVCDEINIKLVELIKQIALLTVTGPHPISFRLNRTNILSWVSEIPLA